MHNNKHLLGSIAEGYGYKTHWADSEDSDTAASTGKKLYYLQLSVLVASARTFGYSSVCLCMK
jgi:hypothetical protein